MSVSFSSSTALCLLLFKFYISCHHVKLSVPCALDGKIGSVSIIPALVTFVKSTLPFLLVTCISTPSCLEHRIQISSSDRYDPCPALCATTYAAISSITIRVWFGLHASLVLELIRLLPARIQVVSCSDGGVHGRCCAHRQHHVHGGRWGP